MRSVGGNSNGEYRNMHHVFQRAAGCLAQSRKLPRVWVGGTSWKGAKETGAELLKKFTRIPQFGKCRFL